MQIRDLYNLFSLQLTGKDYGQTAGFAFVDTLCTNPSHAVIVLKFFWYEDFSRGEDFDKVNNHSAMAWRLYFISLHHLPQNNLDRLT